MHNGIAAGAIFSVADALSHPHTKHREMVVEQGDYKGVGIPIKFSEDAGAVRTPPPKFAQDNEAVLKALGYGEADIARLYAAGAVVKQRRKL